MRKKFKDLLHRYKVESFRISRANDTGVVPAEEILRFTEQALNNAYHFQFHKDPSPERLETFTMIKNFTLESLMPPVIEKVMRRVVVLEKQYEALVGLVDELLEVLSDDEPATRRDRAG